MDFAIPTEMRQLRKEVRAFIDAHLSAAVVERMHRTGTVHDWGFHKALVDEGWLVPRSGAGEMVVLLEEMARAAAPVDGWISTMNVAATLQQVASEEVVDAVLPPVLAGEALICLGLSEPDAGSDVAAVATRARQDGDSWVIDGQKMFTTLAHESRWVLLLTRTDAEAPKHKGLTTFCVPLQSSGIEVRPVRTLGGERTNMTFYDGVQVEDRWRVGPPGEGWQVLMALLAQERGGEFSGTALFVGSLARLVDQARAATSPDARSARAVLARAEIELRIARLLVWRSAWVAQSGRSPVVEGALAKLYASEALKRSANAIVNLLGPRGTLHDEDGIEHAVRHSAVTTIYGGTSEIMRTILGEAGLGLPR